MKKIIEEKARMLTFDKFVQEAVLGKIASDIYNEAKKIAPMRHVGIRKSKLLSRPGPQAERAEDYPEAEVEKASEKAESEAEEAGGTAEQSAEEKSEQS